eukprot:5970031-Amphidinium_carterae.1
MGGCGRPLATMHLILDCVTRHGCWVVVLTTVEVSGGALKYDKLLTQRASQGCKTTANKDKHHHGIAR